MKNPLVKTLFIIVILIAFSAGFGIYSSSYYQNKANQTVSIPGFLWPNPKQLRAFETINQNGEIFGLDNLIGNWSFLFFGFTHCPDVCPISLAVLNEVDSIIQKNGADTPIQTIFVTVDPERDTTEVLKQYIEYYNKDFIALGGNKEQVDSIARQIGVAYGKSQIESDTKYQVDHSASIFLVDPKGRFVGVFSSPHEVQPILEQFNSIRTYLDKQSQ